jgi:hypothetical protein
MDASVIFPIACKPIEWPMVEYSNHLYQFEINSGISFEVVLSLPSFVFPGPGHGTSSAVKWVDEEAAAMLAGTHTTKSRVEILKMRFVLDSRLSRCLSVSQPGPWRKVACVFSIGQIEIVIE